MAEWYYRIMGEEVGPVSGGELKRLAQSGTVAPDTHVRQGENGDWRSAASIRNLFTPRTSDSKPRSSPSPKVRPKEQKTPPAPPGRLRCEHCGEPAVEGVFVCAACGQDMLSPKERGPQTTHPPTSGIRVETPRTYGLLLASGLEYLWAWRWVCLAAIALLICTFATSMALKVGDGSRASASAGFWLFALPATLVFLAAFGLAVEFGVTLLAILISGSAVPEEWQFTRTVTEVAGSKIAGVFVSAVLGMVMSALFTPLFLLIALLFLAMVFVGLPATLYAQRFEAGFGRALGASIVLQPVAIVLVCGATAVVFVLLSAVFSI